MRKQFLIIAFAAIAVLAIVMAFAINHEIVTKHTYPQDAFHEDSNLAVRGIIISIEQNYKAWGWDYHIYHYYIQLNITEIVWVSNDFSGPVENGTVYERSTIGIGYDNPDNPQVKIGQIVECKGCYVGVTDLPSSFKITVSPSINGSYLKPLT